LKTTLLGGVFFLMPIVTLAIILDKALQIAEKIAKPVSEHVPGGWDFGLGKATLLAIALTVVVCFQAGLLARTKYARWVATGIETAVLSKIPAYEYFKQLSTSALGLDDLGKHPVVLVQVDAGWQIGVQVEDLGNGLVAVFIPDAPDPHSGALLYMQRERVTPVNVSIASALKCLKSYGAGSTALLQKLAANRETP
jgi:uncharacterized membrane protein